MDTMEKEELADEIVSRLEELRAERARYEGAWSDAQDFCAPYAYNWSDLDDIPRHPKRFTSDPCSYLDILVSGLIGYSVSPSIKWFALSLADERLNERYGVKDWLEKTEQALVAAFIRSDLYSSVRPAIQDKCVIGHGVLFIGENLRKGTLRFSHQSPNEIFLDTDRYGEVDTVIREFRMTVRQMVEQFGEENVSENVRLAYSDYRRRGERRTVIFAVYPRSEYDESTGLSRDFPFAAVYIDRQDKHVISESGFMEFPYAVFEYAQYTGRAYGDSIAQEALEDVRFLDITTETTLKIAQIAADPAIKVSPNMRNVSILPGAVNELNRPDDVIEAIKTGENYPISLDVQRQKNEAVRRRFNVDFFQALQSLEGKVMTATEVMELQGEKAATLSSLIVSMNGALSAIIERSFNLLLRAGRLPPVPESLSGTGASMKIDFIGPLAQAQKRYYAAGSASNAIGQVAPVIQLFPAAGDFIDGDELVKQIMTSAGMPQSVVREDRDVDNIRRARLEARQQAAQEAQQQAAQQLLIQNADKLGRRTEEGSPLAAMNEQMAGGMNGIPQ